MEKDKLLRYKGAAPIAVANALNFGELTKEEWRLIVQLNKTDSWDKLDDVLKEEASEIPKDKDEIKGVTTTKTTALKSSVVKPTAPEITTPKNDVVRPAPVKSNAALQDSLIIEREYYRVSDSVSDILYEVLELTPSEQSVYNRLYRLSYGYQKNWCRVGASAIRRSCQLKSQSTVLKVIHSLIKKKCIEIVEEAANNPKGTLYRVFLPPEIEEVAKRFPELKSNTTTTTKITALKSSAVKNSALKSTTPENTTLIFEETTTKNSAVKNDAPPESSDIEGVSGTTTKNTTLIFGANIVHSFKQFNSTLSPAEIIDGFYQGIGQQKISKKERERAKEAYNSLKKDGFTKEEICFAVKWTVQNVKDARSFAIIEHTIGQALPEREKILEQQALEEKRGKERQAELEKRLLEEEENAKLDEYISNLSPAEKEALESQARDELIRKEQIKERFINPMVLNAKVKEIIKREYDWK